VVWWGVVLIAVGSFDAGIVVGAALAIGREGVRSAEELDAP
jgi:hypothetical protein